MLITTWTNIVISFLGVATGTFAARALHAQGRGELAAIQLWPTLIASAAALGLPEALVFYSARNHRESGRYTGSATLMGLLSSVAGSAIAYCLLPSLMPEQSSTVIAGARFYLLLGPIQILLTMPYYAVRGLQQIGTWNLLRTLPVLAWAVALAAGYLLRQCKPTFFAASHLIILGLLVPPVAFVVSRSIPPPFRPNRELVPAILRYALPSAATMIPQLLNLRLVQIVMAAALPAKLLGFYTVALAWSAVANPLLQGLGVVLFPRVASQAARTDQAKFFCQGARVGTLLAIVTAVCVAAPTPWIMPLLFGDEFRAAVVPALILVGMATLAGINLIFEEGLRGLGDLRTIIFAECAGVAILGITLGLLIRPFGLLGACLGSFGGCAATAGTLVIRARRHANGALVQLTVPNGSDFVLIRENVARLLRNAWRHNREAT